MKVVDYIVNKVGQDKVLHFLGGAWITSMFTPLSWVGVVIGIILTMTLSYIKEKYLDDSFDKYDIIAAGIGSSTSIILYLLLFLFF